MLSAETGPIELQIGSQVEELGRRLLERVKPKIAHLRPLPTSVVVPDSTSKFLGLDRQGRAAAVVICSPTISPDTVANHLELKKTAWCSLGSWSDVILSPLQVGRIDGLSYAVFPHCRSLSESRYSWAVQREWIRPVVLRWLQGAIATTVIDATEKEREEGFVIPLQHIADWEAMPIDVRSAADVAIRRLERGSWQPRHCFMHGDLWKGNILLAPRHRGHRRFVLIDWGGSLIRGYGVYDLLTLAHSMKLRGYRLKREVKAHCRILGCDLVDARSHLLVALGYHGINLAYCPFENYLATGLRCLQLLNSIGA
jgi:hypothetical protein